MAPKTAKLVAGAAFVVVAVAGVVTSIADVDPHPMAPEEQRAIRISAATARIVLESAERAQRVRRFCPGGSLDAGRRSDAWGTPLRVECLDTDISVVSAGPDRVFGTEDDMQW